MFAATYFAPRQFAPRYFPEVGDTPAPPTGQVPRATRYRKGYRAQMVIRVLWLLCSLARW